MDNKEEQALSPAVPTLTHIHQSACQPSSQQAVSQTAGAPHGRKRFQPICFLHVSPLMAPFIKMARSQSALSPRHIYRLGACVPSQKQTHSSPPAHMLSQKGFAYGPAHLIITWICLDETRYEGANSVGCTHRKTTTDVWCVNCVKCKLSTGWATIVARFSCTCAVSISFWFLRCGGITERDFAQQTTPWFTDIKYSNARQEVLA